MQISKFASYFALKTSQFAVTAGKPVYDDVGPKRESGSFEYPNKFSSALCIFHMAKSFFNAK